MSNLLLDQPPVVAQPALIRSVGLSDALVLQQLHYWLQRASKSHGGHAWVYKTYGEWADEIGISAAVARGALNRLRGDETKGTPGIVKAVQNPTDPRDRTLWWRIDYDEFTKLYPDCGSHGPSVLANSSDCAGEQFRAPVPSPPTEAQGLVNGQPETTSRERASTPKKTPPPDGPPDGFPDELRPHANAVLSLLREAAVERGAKAVTVRAVGRVVMDHPRKPLVAAAQSMRAWLLDGNGAAAPCKDVVMRYRRWVGGEPDLAALERLDAVGRPTAWGGKAATRSVSAQTIIAAERRIREAHGMAHYDG